MDHDFVINNHEKSVIENPYYASTHNLLQAVYANDPVALWRVGTHLLTSLDESSDYELAHYYFAKSASFGFAPALNQLRLMYALEGNMFLELIYLKIIIDYDHDELLDLYHKIKISITQVYGHNVMQEIEKIIAHKKAAIERYTHAQQEERSTNMTIGLGIVGQDVLFDATFWCNIQSGLLVTGSLEQWLQDPHNHSLMLIRVYNKFKEY